MLLRVSGHEVEIALDGRAKNVLGAINQLYAIVILGDRPGGCSWETHREHRFSFVGLGVDSAAMRNHNLA